MCYKVRFKDRAAAVAEQANRCAKIYACIEKWRAQAARRSPSDPLSSLVERGIGEQNDNVSRYHPRAAAALQQYGKWEEPCLTPRYSDSS